MTTSHSRASAGTTAYSGADELGLVRAAQLGHPSIVPVYRVGRAGEGGRVVYFVMRYLRGGSLRALLARRGRLTAREIRRALAEAGSALGSAAGRGIVHGDVTPANLLLDEAGRCVVTDFGIARAAGADVRLAA